MFDSSIAYVDSLYRYIHIKPKFYQLKEFSDSQIVRLGMSNWLDFSHWFELKEIRFTQFVYLDVIV